MPTYIELPFEKTSSKLADWLEVNALLDQDGSVSKQDLVYPLKREQDLIEDQIDLSETDLLASQVFCEIADRSRSAGDGYPFSLDGEKIKRRNPKGGFLSYVFCILVSFFGVEKQQYCVNWKTSQITKKFEELSAVAIQSLLDNQKLPANVEVFGSPRRWKGRVANPSFLEALKQICFKCGEMQPRIRPAASSAKDAGVDIIAWKRFPDKLSGGLLFWGQCAAGTDWTDKLGEVKKIRAFVEDCTPPVTGTFIPHVPDTSSKRGLDNWFIHVQRAGMLFNRCRIAFLTSDWKDKWVKDLCRKALKQIRLQSAKDLLQL